MKMKRPEDCKHPGCAAHIRAYGIPCMNKSSCSCSIAEPPAEALAEATLRHKWAKEIAASFEGKTIQVRNQTAEHTKDWVDVDSPAWITTGGCEYRIKPEPKPDIVLYGAFGKKVEQEETFFTVREINQYQRKASDNPRYPVDNVRFVVDGATGELKSVEIVK